MRLHRSFIPGFAAAGLLVCASPVFAQCQITGPTTFCPAGVQICAMSGSDYQWTGPNGLVASTQCITVTQPGTYSVSVFDGVNALWFGPCSQDMVALPSDSCAIKPPPPPPPSDTVLIACPRPATWWSRQCRGDAAHHAIDAAKLGSIAACADAGSNLFTRTAGGDGLCGALAWNERWDARKRTERQYAAVLMNVCARRLHVLLPDSTRPGLEGSARPALLGGASIGDWAHATDVRLLSLRAGSLRDSSVRNSYRRIYALAWMLDHGVGMGATCNPPRQREAEVTAAAAAPENAAGSTAEAATLADAMGEMLGVDGALSTPAPNPSRGTMAVAFAVSNANGSEVRLAVYDLAGRQIRTLASGRFALGVHDVTWDGRADQGQSVRAGVYFISGRVGDTSVSRSVLRVE